MQGLMVPSYCVLLSLVLIQSHAQSALKLSIARPAQGSSDLSWVGNAAYSYNVQGATSLSPPWKSVSGLLTNDSASFKVPLSLTNTRTFYRLIEVPQTVLIVDTNNNGTVQLSATDVLEVKLISNASTGFRWEVSTNSTANLNLIGTSFIPGSGAGGAGRQIYYFEPIAKGQGALQLIYRRSFDASPGQTYEVTVVTN